MKISILRKDIWVILLSAIIFSSCGIIRKKITSNTFKPLLNNSQELSYTPIIWKTDSLANKVVEKSGFYVPVKIKGLNKEVYMQFDLGSTLTMLYENTLSVFIDQNPSLKNDTINKKNHIVFKNAEIKISDNVKLKAEKIYVLKNFGYDYIDSSFTIIGSLGYDIIGDNILILDFKNDQYALATEIPIKMKNQINFIENPDLDKFPIILPFKIGNKKIRLFYDTGSSMFPIVTGTKRLKKVSKNREIDSIGRISAWGNYLSLYRPKELKDKIGNLHIGKFDLGKVDFYGLKSMNKYSYVGKYLYGITGNVIFDNKIIVIDRKNNKFGIIN